MKDLIERFQTLPQHYPQLLDQALARKGHVAYAAADFFTLQPFIAELMQLSEQQTRLYQQPEEVPGDDVYLLLLSDQGLEYARWMLGDEVHYDFFFIADNDAEIRLQAYHNAGQVKAVEAERLVRNEQGLPSLYQQVNEFIRETRHYQYTTLSGEQGEVDICNISIEGFNPLHNHSYRQQQRVFFVPGSYTVDRIESLDDDGDVLFQRAMQQASLDELLDQAADVLTRELLQGLERAGLPQTIYCVLFEYTLQGPFPPTLALIQPHEVDDNEEYGPLSWLNAPDAEIFSEDDFDAVDFHRGHSALFDRLNARLEEMEFDEQNDRVEQFYVSFCQALMNNPQLRQYLRCDEQFFVCARDFEACNEQDLLARILPPRQWQPMKDAIDCREQQQQQAHQSEPLVQEVTELLAQKQADYAQLKQQLKQQLADAKTSLGYYPDNLLTLEPFALEQKHHRHLPLSEMLRAEPPESGHWFEYQLHNGRAIYCRGVRDGQVFRESFICDRGDQAECYHFHVAQDILLEDYEQLSRDRHVPRYFRSLSSHQVSESRYQYDESHRIKQIENRHAWLIQGVRWTEPGYVDVSYHSDGSLAALCGVLDDKPYVLYSSDNQFLEQHIDACVPLLHDLLLDELRQQNIWGQTILLEYDECHPLPPALFYIADGYWQETFPRQYFDSELYRTSQLGLYLMISDSVTTDGYFDNDFKRQKSAQFYQRVCQQLEASWQAEFNTTADIRLKTKWQMLPELPPA